MVLDKVSILRETLSICLLLSLLRLLSLDSISPTSIIGLLQHAANLDVGSTAQLSWQEHEDLGLSLVAACIYSFYLAK